MHIELRKIKHAAFLSEETNAYTADLYVDGKLIAHVGNDGHGGCDHQHPAKGKTYDDVKQVNDWVKANHAPRTTDMMLEGKPFVMDVDLEVLCGELLTDWLIERDLKRLINRTVAFVPAGAKEVRSYKGKNIGDAAAKLIAITETKFPGARILNTMPFAEAKVLYKSTAA